MAVAQEFPTTLDEIIKKGEFSPHKIINTDKTRLYWKKMPDQSYISKEEKSVPGYKPTKDRLTLLLGGNTAFPDHDDGTGTSDDCKLCHSLNHRTLIRNSTPGLQQLSTMYFTATRLYTMRKRMSPPKHP